MLYRKWTISLIIFVLICLPCYAADITLRWDPNVETDLAGYELHYKADIPGSPYDGTELITGCVQGDSPVVLQTTDPSGLNYVDNTGTEVEFTLTGLNASYVYFLVLTAYDTAGNVSGNSNEVSTFYISTPQNNFTVNSTNYTEFTVSGRGAAGIVVSIYSDNTLVGTAIPDVNGMWSADVDFTGVTEGAVSLTARTITSSSTTVISGVITGLLDISAPAPPTIPQGLSAAVVSQSQIDLNWEPSAGADGYIVYRDNVNIATTPNTNYSDTGLAPSTTYEYEVASYYTVNNPSDRSSLESGTTLSEDGTSPPPSNGGSKGCFISSVETDKELFMKAGALYLAITSMLAGITVGLIFLKKTIKRSVKKWKNHTAQTDAI